MFNCAREMVICVQILPMLNKVIPARKGVPRFLKQLCHGLGPMWVARVSGRQHEVEITCDYIKTCTWSFTKCI